ncbi:unnamed protein product [Adineta ricciae]|uniref:G-protein coupled receptors family 1 profile domain-containing protein n=1 Tax=Adineta ricciae TaxID=249248 RepID=A0A814EUT9_ADIRI|nr:unnamed protein product [Adineta ricciae]
MSIINADVLWLAPLFISRNTTMTETTFSYQLASLTPAFNLSLTSAPSSAFSSKSIVLSHQNQLPLLKWSVRIIGGLLIIIGGIGNTLSALTLSRKKLRAQVTSIYLIALALSDLGKDESFVLKKRFSSTVEYV